MYWKINPKQVQMLIDCESLSLGNGRKVVMVLDSEKLKARKYLDNGNYECVTDGVAFFWEKKEE